MQRTDKNTAPAVRFGLFAAVLFAAGCSVQAPLPETGPQVEPQPVEPEVIVATPQPAAEPTVAATVAEPTKLPPVAIVLTSSQPAYASIASELARRFDDYEIYDLNDDNRPPVTILRLINDSESGAVVAIGLRAASSAVAMSSKPVVFSQVFNHRDHGLLTENSRGISAMPPLAAQLAALKEADPTIVRIGAIIGKGHDDLIEEAESAAASLGMELRLQVTHSDQETLYFFKRMVRDIDGFWLFPDNRVLSARALQQIMDEAQRLQVPVLVQSDSLLQMGATISVSSVAADIAETITKVIRQIQAGIIDQVPPMTPLSEIRVTATDAIQVVDR